MERVGESINMDQPVVDNVVHHVIEQIVQSVHEVTTTLSPPSPALVVSEIVSTTLEPVSSTLAEIVNEAANSLATEVTAQPPVVEVTSMVTTIVDQVSTVVEKIVQPVVSDLPIESIPQVVQEAPTFVDVIVETVTERVTEFVTEATKEFTTLLSPPAPNQHHDQGKVNMEAIKVDHLSPKIMLTHDYVQWLHETRLILAISVSMIYLFTIFFIRRLLTKRYPFHLRNLLILWNLGLAGFSVACSVYLARHLIPWTKEHGIGSTICSATITDSTRLWLNLFTWSKLLELGNTMFVVLRKKKLRFIHIYYHLSTLIYTFYLFGGGIITSGVNPSTPAYYSLLVLINVTVQGIIYTYYTIRSRGFDPPKVLTITLALIQIIQFIAILFILTVSLYHHLSPSDSIISTLSSFPIPASLTSLTNTLSTISTLGTHCSPSMSTDVFGITVIGTNFILFANHFRSYFVKPKTIKLL